MAGFLTTGNLEVEKENVNMKKENELSRRQRKKYLEILSITCSTIGINIMIACFYGVTDIFGLKSPDMIFKCAFAFLFASVLLGILAMISSIIGYDFLQISSFVFPKCSLLFGYLKILYSPKIECIEKSEKMSDVDSNFEKNEFKTSRISDANESCHVTLKSLDDSLKVKPMDKGTLLLQKKNILPEETAHVTPDKSKNTASELYKNQLSYPRTSETIVNQGIQDSHSNSLPSVVTNYGLPTNTSVKTLAHSQWKNKQSALKKYNQESPKYRGSFMASEIRDYGMCSKSSSQSSPPLQWKNNQSRGKALLQVRKRLNTLSLGHCYPIEDSSRLTNGSRIVSFDVQKDHETAHFAHIVRERSFSAEICANKKPFHIQMKSREVYEKWLPMDTDSYKIRNKDFGARNDFNFCERLSSFTNTCQITPKDQVSDVTLKLNRMNFLS